ncbi:PQQ-dependent sugar dehydrogenase [Acinetobacter lanii]|uniref:PQQ-dependent sugar dehydrogenase n=1 Tax=Acinetobacter lanii TaxID=2715163 RepID=A0A6G8S0B0_9GAMM|nr:PQQ-dependent sugar dehydrogenase [Acinetobacter lanii]QIO07629.1 PQQ-dependent sugar dehydrogenase [Acinetobacter lanii]
MNHKLTVFSLVIASLGMMACYANETTPSKQSSSNATAQQTNLASNASHRIEQTYQIEKMAQFNEPWAMSSLPNGKLLVTERKGTLRLFDPATKKLTRIEGVPTVAYGGQGGLGDVVVHPDFAQNRWVYLSYAEKGQGGTGAVVVRAELDLSQAKKPQLRNIKRIWEQVPKVEGEGHYSHRILFDDQGKLWISSGERQQFTPAQDMKSNLGKIVRLNADGTPVQDNPFYQQGGVTAQIWSLGHRNPLGLAFDANKQLWVVEMGPKGGDELNRVEKGANYGYPQVSNGDHYDGKPIPDHATRPEFKAPEIHWTPVISPSSLMIYQGNQFPQWKNKALISGLSSKAIVVVDIESQPVQEVQRLDLGKRIRAVQQAQDGSIWVLEDEAGAHLLKLTPKT